MSLWGSERGVGVTPRTMMNNGQWERYCEFNDINPNAVISGEIDMDEELEPMSDHLSSRFGF